MPVVNLYRTIRIAHAERGHMVSIVVGDSNVIGVVLGNREGGGKQLAVLRSIEGRSPHLYHTPDAALCIDFGPDWIFEPHYDSTSLPNSNDVALNPVGVAFVQDGAIVIRFDADPLDGISNPELIDLGSLERVEFANNGIKSLVPRWQVFLNEAHRDLEKPFIKHGFGNG